MLSEATVADYFKTLLSQSKTQPVSLEQIILTQIDEPHQRNCIYRLKRRNVGHNPSQIKFFKNVVIVNIVKQIYVVFSSKSLVLSIFIKFTRIAHI